MSEHEIGRRYLVPIEMPREEIKPIMGALPRCASVGCPNHVWNKKLVPISMMCWDCAHAPPIGEAAL